MATLAREAVQTDPRDVSRAELYRDDVWQAPFRELRSNAPVHRVEQSDFGPDCIVTDARPDPRE